ncbi:MAG: RIP metalloprotease RseP [Gammaproteobacteria bacterium]
MLSSLFYFFVTLLLLILVHELGHFLTARWCGVKVLRFSFGFGKVIGQWRDKNGTEFIWALLPLGGYVKFLDENEGPVAPKLQHQALNRKSRWIRVLVVFAGPLFNFLFAFILMWLVAVLGIKSFAPRIEDVKPNSVAAIANIGKMQEIIALNNKKINSWRDVHYALMPLIGSTKEVSITVKSLEDGKISTHFLPLSQWTFDTKHSDLLDSLGIVPLFPQLPITIGTVHPDSPAQIAGLAPDDVVLAVDNQPISDWSSFVQYVHARPGSHLVIKISRQGQIRILPVHLREQEDSKTGLLGISPRSPEIPSDWLRLERSGPIDALGYAWHQTITFMQTTITLMGRTIIGKLPLNQLSGPIGIAKAAGESVQIGPVYYLFFIALLSISVGVLNLLPIPLLDGGHLLYELIEVIIRRPLSKELKTKGIFVGMVLVFILTLIALYNDLA